MKTGLFLVVTLLSAATPCIGQEFRIYTKVYDDSAVVAGTNQEATIVARSLTLFHAGRVYDYMRSVGEVTIFEPMQNRFTILNTDRQISTVVHTDEIKHLMQTARRVTSERITELRKQNPQSRTAKMLAFQLQPAFRDNFDRKTKTLSLVSPYIRYDVRIESVTKKHAKTYRHYADWIHQLNFVLHPRVLLPQPRLALNKFLAEKQALPLQVKLQVNMQPSLHLRAEHRIHWKFDRKDRAMINVWNRLLSRRTTKKVPLREYQRLLGMRSTSR